MGGKKQTQIDEIIEELQAEVNALEGMIARLRQRQAQASKARARPRAARPAPSAENPTLRAQHAADAAAQKAN